MKMMDLLLRLLWIAILLSPTAIVASETSAAQRDEINKYAIASIFPESGPVSGGTGVVLIGSGNIEIVIDGDELTCVFESKTNSDTDTGWAYTVAQWITPTDIQCVTPEWGDAGVNVSLSLESNGTNIATSPSLFHYYETPAVTSIYPTFGAALGGTTITLRGSGFSPLPDISCRLGNVDIPALWKGYDEVACTTPPGVVASSNSISLTLNGVDFSSSPAMYYRYTESPMVHTIWPTKGSLIGGSLLILEGEGFEDSSELKCVFRLHNNYSILIIEAEFMSSTELTCTNPAVDEPTQTTVHVTVNGVDATVNGAKFEYIGDAVVSSIRPTGGPISGGTWVSLIGSGMVNGDSLRCVFGGSAPVSGYWISHTEVQCILPRVGRNGIVNATLSLNGVDYTSSSAEFLYYRHPTISSIHPSFGVSNGGTTVAVYGYGFLSSQELMCRFGTIYVAASFINEEEVLCVSPGSAGSSHLVSVSLNGVDFSPSSIDFRYKAPIQVQSLKPTWADEAGGTSMRVVGSGFEDTNELACIFDHRNNPPIHMPAEFSSSTELQCPTPPMTARSEVTLRVTVNGADISSGVRFEYVSRAVLSTMNPIRGPMTGGTPVILTGRGFLYEDTIRCRFGEILVPAKWMSLNMVRCESPPSDIDSVNVSYSNDGVNFAESLVFTFRPPTTISNMEPKSGSRRGGTEVQIFGDGFTSDFGWKCLFNNAAVPVVYSSPSEIRCLTATSFEEVASLTIVEPDGSVIETGFNFHYYEEFQALSLFPESGPVSGGTSITIKLRGLQEDSSYDCVFGNGAEASAMLLNNSFVECITPRWYIPGETTLVLMDSTSPVAIVTESMSFTFYQHPVVSSASPSSFYFGFSTDIKVDIVPVDGSFLRINDHAINLSCQFGKEEVQARWISDAEIVCRYASKSINPRFSHELPLLISMNGVDFLDSGILLSIYPDLTVTSISPNYGSVLGKTKPIVTGTGFVDSFSYQCLFGTKFVGAEFLSPNELICDSSPSSLPGREYFWICTDGDCVGGEGLAFDNLELLHLLDASPMEGSISGGTLVHVKSNHPFSTHSVCSFGNKLAKIEVSPYDGDGSSTGVCESPQQIVETGSPTGVDFSISANGQEFTHKPFQFVYSPNNGSEVGEMGHAVHISLISPATGLPGTNVSVTGSGFNHLHEGFCTFGIRDVPAVSISNSSLICTAPWNPRFESVSFKVTDSSKLVEIYPGNENITFTYVELPRLISVEPAVVVKTNASTSVTIEGQNFDILPKDDIRCRIGSSEVPARFDNSSGKMLCNHLFPVEGSFPVELLSEQFGVVASSQVKIHVIELPRLDHLEPPVVVAQDRNTDVMVKGDHFVDQNLNCFFDGQPAHATFISDSEVLCRLPRHGKAQSYEVHISNGGVLDQLQSLMLEVISPPSIAAVTPSMGQAGSKVTITGKSFHPHIECQFGSQVTETMFVNSTVLQCIAPEDALRESVQVYIALDGVPISTGPPLHFTFVDLSVNSVSPTFGDVNGGTQVIFNLKEESPDVVSHCIFGDDVVLASIDQSELICVSPPMTRTGAVHVGVSVNGGDFSMSQLTFEYTKPATFSSMYPRSGSEAGGTSVTLNGSGFVNGNNMACYFGNVKVAGQWVSDEELACETPFSSPGNYKVEVTLNGVDALDTYQSFDFYPRMTTLFSMPSFGETGGDTLIHVYGTNFRWEDILQCRFGTISADAKYVSPNQLECITPTWETAELVGLTVVSENGDTAVVDSGFEYYAPFHLLSIHPGNGFVRGGTDVIVNGVHFSQTLGSVQCTFGDVAVKATVVSDDLIRCTTPPTTSTGDAEFSMVYGSDKFTVPGRVPTVFEYDDEIVLDAVSPSVVPSTTDRLTSIKLYGALFRNRKELRCMITSNQMTMDATFITDSQVLCQIPIGLQPGAYELSISNNGQDFSEATLEFSVIDPILVKTIRPVMGSPDTVQVISLEGNNFQDLENLACLVDEKYVVPVHFDNTTSIQCSLPLHLDTGAVSIALILDGVPISTGPPLFFTFIDLSLASISPSFGDVNGGTRVTFNLKEESPDVVSHCIFGKVNVPARIHEAELMCVSPPMPRAGPVHVGVSVNGEHFSMSQFTFGYTKPAVFSSMYPRSGPEMGGTGVVLTGSSFANSNRVACYFGNVKVAGRWVSDEKLVCETPAMKPGKYKLKVTLNGVDTLRTPWQFAFHKEIDVLYASPSSGTILGGTEISIVGKSFASTENLTCQFGDLGMSRAAFVTSNEISCLSPDVSQEISDVFDVGIRVSLNGVDFSPAMARFRFVPPAVIHTIFPLQGTVSGGTQVTVKGANLFPSITSNTAMCIFGKHTVPASLLSTKELTCASPPHSIDEDVFFASFYVSMNGFDLVEQRATTFLYLPNAKTVSIKPSGGPFTGGTLVTVTGIDFGQSSAESCKFGSLYSDGIVYISDQTIQCISPPHPTGTVDFAVTTEGNEISAEDVVFEFYQAPTILFASPASGPHYGETVVRVYGNGFRPNVNYVCYFGDTSVPGQFAAIDAIECASPRMNHGAHDETHVDLLVAEENSNFTANTLHFSYLPEPSLDHLSPSYFFFDGGDSISVFGSHLNTTEHAWCRFTLPSKAGGSHYYETVQASSVSNDLVDCQVPPYPSWNLQVEAFVEVSTNDWDWSYSRLSFWYVPKPTIKSIEPTIGSVNGGTVVTVHGTDFLQESNLRCAFGNAESTPIEWVSLREISCTVPAAAYPVDVPFTFFVENSGFLDGTETSAAQRFVYHRELSLEEAFPMRGFVSGGTVVTVRGTGFIDVPTLSCRFGSTSVLASFRSMTSIECPSPPVNQARDVELKVSLNGIDFSSFSVSSGGRKSFRYDEELELFHTIPSSVLVSAATNEISSLPVTEEHIYITIVGSGFVNTTSLACRFGQNQLTFAHYVSESELKCALPETMAKAEESDVRISLNGGADFSRKMASIAFVEPALITSVYPKIIQERSEVDLLVRGENFLRSSDLQCRFGGRRGHLWSPARWIEDGMLKCTTPPLLNMTYDGVEYIGISNNGGYDTARQMFTLEITSRTQQFLSMHPVIGYIDGETDVVITLGNAASFLPADVNLMCQFGTEAVPATLLLDSRIMCKSPPYHPGETSLKLISDGVHVLAAGAFEYISPPRIQSLQPTLGPLNDVGTVVSIHGTGFIGVTHCRFGLEDDFQPVRANVESDFSLSCNAPVSKSDADASVEITHNGQDFIGSGHVFSYRASPRLLSLAPSFGSDLGGKAISVLGENFMDTPSAMCRFGASLVNAIYISPSVLSCTSPASKIGLLPLSITMNGLDFITNETLVYESIKLPQIKSMEPTVGTLNGDTRVVLNTTALHQNRLACHFDEIEVPATYISANQVSCTAPTVDDSGVVNVSISVDGERYLADGMNTIEFAFVSKPEVTSIAPNFGWMTGGAQVSLSVKDLEPFSSSELMCSFGDSNNFTEALQVGSVVWCHSPPFYEDIMKQHAPIVLRISDGLNAFDIQTPVFTYIKPAIVTRIDPPIGSIRGGSIVRVYGINFSNKHGLQCIFGQNSAVDAEFVNEREVQCVAPEWRGGPKRVDVHVGVKNGPKLSSHASFEYLAHPTIQSIHPKFGSINGGTSVMIRGNALSWPDASSYLSCRFGNSTLVPVAASPDGHLVCISPPAINAELASGGEGRTVQVSVYVKHGQVWLASSDDLFIYADHIEVGALIPNSGPINGGTIVTLPAQGLHQHHLPIDEITCHFGNSIVPSSYFEVGDVLKCVSPAIDSRFSSKTVLVNVGINGLRDVTSIGQVFTYYRAPSVNSISPSVGYLEGGEGVLISGNGFRNEEGLGCIFGNGLVSPKVVWLSDTSVICSSPVADRNMTMTGVSIRVTNNGVDYADSDDAPEYMFMYRPDASKVEPDKVQWEMSTNVTITGKNLMNVSACRFGDIDEAYPTFNVTKNSVMCEVPPAISAPLSFLPSMSESEIPIFLELENGIVATGLDISYKIPPPKVPDKITQPKISSISPIHGSSIGGDWIRVLGEDFLNTEELACQFGEASVSGRGVQFVSANEIRCRTASHLPGTVAFDVVVSRAEENQPSDFEFTFVSDLSITSLFPSSGSIKGGTDVRVFGSFPSSSLDDSELDIKCKFGLGGVVMGELVSQNEISCSSPPAAMPDTVEVRVSRDGGHNFAKSSSWFSYVHVIEIESLIPSYGYLSGGTSVEVVTRNLRNSTGLKCFFGEVSAEATFYSADRASCVSPPHQTEMKSRVAVRLASAGDIGSSWKYFEYIPPPQVLSFSPVFVNSGVGGAAVTVRGSGFRNVLQLMCAFGKVHVRATVADTSTLLCHAPRHPAGVVDFHIVDQYALVDIAPAIGSSSQFHFIHEASVHSVNPTWNVAEAGSIVFARGTNFDTSDDIACIFGTATANATVMTDSLLSCPTPFVESKGEITVALGLYGSTSTPGNSLVIPLDSPTAPNGTTMDHNITMCEPGTFQPQNGQGQCLQCPIGYICPSFGMSKPIVCPAGSICEGLSLVVPSSPCVSGHFCNEGTKMSSQIAQSTTETWLLEEESGVLTTAMSNSAWDYINRTHPATGERRISHPPIDENVKAEQPFPCSIGLFCTDGVSSAEHREADYATPQPCFDGYFCSRGSTTPEGKGACPAGFYCPTQILAIPCEIGNHCPGTGNTSPMPCYPGSYSSLPGQRNCNLCEIGFQCPGFGRAAPEPCRAGWLCDEEGASIPTKRCPSGFVCEEGTTTDDPNSLFGIPPRPCPGGAFCLDGVAHNTTSSWLPSFEMGALAPQPCLEGYFCPTNSSTPMGGGKCYPGHYCPESSPYPIQTPPGAFAGDGAIVGSLCFPGTFSPRPGQVDCSPCPAGSSCLRYGTYVPRICGPGTYRSKADSVQCKPCPERTYSFASGLTDISQCLPCAEGRVCGSKGMADLKQSDVCSEGSVCGYMTDRTTQFTTQCPSGSYCGNETTTLNQFFNPCLSGSYCERGTTSNLKTRDKCGKSHYCMPGTPSPEPFITRCPRQTTSLAGAKDMDFCSPNLVAICDKMPSSETNPFDRLSYYPLEHATSEQEESVEMLVVKKIFPFNEYKSDVVPWKNDTLEVLRTCPAYGILPEQSLVTSNQEALIVMGRNFYNSTDLTCRYRICLDSTWVSDGGIKLITPELCRYEVSNMSEPITQMGKYMTQTRVSCPMPDFEPEDDFQPLNGTSTPGTSAQQLCLRDDNRQVYLSQECSDSDLASGHCAFEDGMPSLGLRKRVYSLVLPCSEDEVLNRWCDDVPTKSSKLNPCLTQRIAVDVSNNGKKFSGDETVVPYTSVDSSAGFSYDADVSHQVLPTYAIYEIIPENYLIMLEVDSSIIQKKHLRSSLHDDNTLCHRSSVHEEGSRLAEDGWFEAPYMSRFHLSFDWRHLPSHLVYDEHYKLAVYVVPSRCHESKCNDSGRSHSFSENIPCLQPVELPVWFTDESVDKNQMMNMTITSLDDSRFRVEIQIIDGLALPVANFFENTLSVAKDHPQRANTFRSERNMSPLVSFEEKAIDMPYMFGIRLDEGHSQQVSLPRNLPPRWKSFERGRVLVGMNTTHENKAPTVKDGNESITIGTDFWDNPYPSESVAKQQSDIYFETFHGVSQDGPSYKYEHSSLILPYLPYFSNCREFDSHVPLWALVESATQCQLPDDTVEFPDDWWRRGIPPLPHQDDVKAIGPSDFINFYPIADWCERKLHCNFEEDLPKPDVTPRWFEADSGTALFSIIRDPIDYYQYTGRDGTGVTAADGGGQRYLDSINTLQTFIPAKVDRSPSLNLEGGCTIGACFPRLVTIDISYHQVDVYSKRIVQVKVLYDKFDKDSSNDEYELQIKFYALNYQELVIKFAFSRGLFLLLFGQIGVGTVVAAFIYWVVVRVTTNLERPPRLRITGFMWLTFPPALGGVLLGLMPISIVTASVFYLMKGYLIFTPDTDPDGRRWLFPSSTRLHYSDINIDPDDLQTTRQGRTGLAFVTMALISLYFTSKMFVPKPPMRGNVTDQQASARSLATWKRGNLICSSVAMCLLLVVIVEWSFWGSFGTYIWEAIIFMKILSIFVGSIVDKQLGEALLSAPVMTAMGLVQGIVTMSANDFMDFLLSYIVGFGFMILERMYVGPLQAEVFGWVYDVLIAGAERLQASMPSIFGVNQDKSTLADDALVPEENNNETVEPLLGSFASYSCDTLSLLYTPYIFFVIMAFRDEAEITKIYGIKEADMEYYVLFALAIIPFQIIADILLHNALELLHGWKMHEYLEYCKVRFLQREVWWKGLETSTFDECIEESLRSMDQLCFSSQYYMLNTIHVNAMIYFVLGITMMTKSRYTAFGDPAMFPIITAILLCSMAVKLLLTWIAKLFGLWKIKYEKRGWHAKVLESEGNPNVDQWGDIQVKDHDQYQMEQRISSETFRYKFLNYNRSWILSQLPDMITPRVSANQRPYMINQFARILGQVNGDFSSDSDSDDGPEFEAPSMTASTRTLARTWLLQANRQLRLRKLVQPLIQQSKGNECQICLSRNLLQVETLHSISDIDEQFKNEYQTEEIDQVLFKRFWQRNQRYQTTCLPCVSSRKQATKEKIIDDDRSTDDESDNNLASEDMTQTAESILAKWYVAAQGRLENN